MGFGGTSPSITNTYTPTNRSNTATGTYTTITTNIPTNQEIPPGNPTSTTMSIPVSPTGIPTTRTSTIGTEENYELRIANCE